MSLAGAAAAMGLPEVLVQRSAEARAAETGDSVEAILAAWAGGEATASSPPPDTEPEPTPADEPEGKSVEPEPQPAPAVTIADPQPVASVASAPSRAPVPSEVTVAEAAHLPDVITVPTARIRERTNFSMPSWLTALLIVAPLVALFALGGSATGTCGEATELGVDVITGEIVNCDGSEFTGSQIGGGGTDFVAVGSEIYAAQCAGCHGPNGAGVGNFPALTGVMTTFGACGDHLEWVALGSAGFQAEGRNSYGDTGKSIGGGMPAFGSSLSPEQLAAVVAFERVRFGGGDEAEVGVDCGITEPDDSGGEGTEGGGEGGGEGTETP